MNILIIGAGMYVTGRHGSGNATVLSALAETSKTIPIEHVTVVATKAENERVVKNAVSRINHELKSNLTVDYRPVSTVPEKCIEMLCAENRYQGAIVSVPDHLHFPYTRALILTGVHCLVVKPFTPSIDEARKLIQLQKERGVYGMVEFHKRLDETNLYVKKAIAAQAIGNLLYATVDYSQRISIPRDIFATWAFKTNIFQYLGVHYVDLLYFLTGFIPDRVSAVGTSGILKQSGIDTWDSVHAQILWKNPGNPATRFVTQFATNWIDPECTSALSDQKFKIVGTTGRIECDQKNRGLELVQAGAGMTAVNPYFSESLPDPNGHMAFSGYGYRSINLFIQDITMLADNRITPVDLEHSRPTFRQALISTAVIDAANNSLDNNGEWIHIDESL